MALLIATLTRIRILSAPLVETRQALHVTTFYEEKEDTAPWSNY